MEQETVMNLRRCNHCERTFGTVAAYRLHWGKAKCRSDGFLKRDGAWQGQYGVWWTSDLGHDDTQIDWFEASCDQPYPPGDEAFLRLVGDDRMDNPDDYLLTGTY